MNRLANPLTGEMPSTLGSQVIKQVLQRDRFCDKPGLLSHGQSERTKCFANTLFSAGRLGSLHCSFGTLPTPGDEKMRKVVRLIFLKCCLICTAQHLFLSTVS